MNIQVPDMLLAAVGFCAFIGLFVLFAGFFIWRNRRSGKYSPFTEDFFRLPGHSTGVFHGEIVEKIICNYVYFVVISALVVWKVVFYSVFEFMVLFGLLVLGYLLFKTYPLFEKAHNYRLGCEGEEFTGQELNLLMLSGAYVFHDIPYKYGNIDHIVIGKDKLFVVETKAFKKPQKSKTDTGKNAKVRYDGSTLVFPTFSTSKPLEQVKMAADFVEKVLLKKTNQEFCVVPVVALPGWYVEVDASNPSAVLVINPKRGNALRNRLGECTNYDLRRTVVRHIAAVSRTKKPKSKSTDPNAADEFDFWFNPKPIEDLSWDK